MTQAPIPNRIKELREQNNLTLEDLAFMTGLSESYISRLESGKRNLSVKTMSLLAKALKVEPTELLDVSRAFIDSDIKGLIAEDQEIVPVLPNDKKHRKLIATVPAAYANNEVVMVVGNSLFPRHSDGDLVIFSWLTSNSSQLIGKECVVTLVNGKTYVKTLNPGSAQNSFHLTSFNAPTMLNAEVARFGRIVAVIPA